MKRIIYIIFCISGISCGQHNAELENALKLAGENRGELEKVLYHYSQNPSDSLKLQAATFLIKNMPGHYTLEGSLINACREKIDTDTTASYFANPGHISFSHGSIPPYCQQKGRRAKHQGRFSYPTYRPLVWKSKFVFLAGRHPVWSIPRIHPPVPFRKRTTGFMDRLLASLAKGPTRIIIQWWCQVHNNKNGICPKVFRSDNFFPIAFYSRITLSRYLQWLSTYYHSKKISNQEHLVCPLPSTLSHITRIVTVIITGIKLYPRNQRIQKSAEPSNAKQLKYIEKHILVIH